MATTPQRVLLQNRMRIEFAHTHLYTTPKSFMTKTKTINRTFFRVKLKLKTSERLQTKSKLKITVQAGIKTKTKIIAKTKITLYLVLYSPCEEVSNVPLV